MINAFKTFLLLTCILTLSTGCSTYQLKAEKGKKLIRSGQSIEAAEFLKPEAEKANDDQLIYLLDYATAQQVAKNYEDSTKAFLLAHEIAEVKDYHSLSRVAGSLLLNEGMVQYKGDPFENVLINAMLAINFVSVGDLDAALIETKRLNEKLYKYKFDGKKDFQQNEFAFYLGAIIWEAEEKFDDAYIDYAKAYKLNPSNRMFREALLRSAYLAQRPEELKKWRAKFPKIKFDPKDYKSDKGELVVIFQQGWGPRKMARPESHRFPRLVPEYSHTKGAQVIINDSESKRTSFIYSVEDVAIKTLDSDYAALVAKRVAGVAVKAVAADQIRQKNQLLGDLAWVAMNIADQADLRQWSTLPETFQIARINLNPGKYKVQLRGLDDSGQATGEQSDEFEVIIKKRKKSFISWRSVK